MNNNVVSEQTQMLVDLISRHYQYYYQQSMEFKPQDEMLMLEFYRRFIADFNVELEHIDFAFPITANLGCDVAAEQISRWSVYWLVEFYPQLDVNQPFSCSVQLVTANQPAAELKLICEQGRVKLI